MVYYLGNQNYSTQTNEINYANLLMNYFLDFGTYYFEDTIHENGLLSFEKANFFGSATPRDWHVLTFEPSISAFEANRSSIPIVSGLFKSFQAYNAAIFDYNGTIDFKWCPGNEAGSNCIGESVAEISEVGSQIYSVSAIDVATLIQEIIEKDNEASIYIKCDIEGSEFTVLPRILSIENVGQWVKEMFVEWHERFWNDKTNYHQIVQIKASIEQSCSEKGIILHNWN